MLLTLARASARILRPAFMALVLAASLWMSQSAAHGPPAPPVMGIVGGVAQAVAVGGDYAYLGVGPRLAVLDAQDPLHPTVIGWSAWLGSYVMAIAVHGDHVLVSGGGTPLHVVDVSDPTLPRDLGSVGSYAQLSGIATQGSYAYVAAGAQGLAVFDISRPSAPQFVAEVPLGGPVADVVVAGHYAYTVASDGGLRVVDIANPAYPKVVGMMSMPCAPRAIDLAGDAAAVAGDGCGLRMIDVSDPANPTTQSVTWPPRGSAYDVTIERETAYVAIAPHGDIWAVDITSPEAPRQVSRLV